MGSGRDAQATAEGEQGVVMQPYGAFDEERRGVCCLSGQRKISK
jgi:hypothetical protein